jgi:hypothetical protein
VESDVDGGGDTVAVTMGPIAPGGLLGALLPAFLGVCSALVTEGSRMGAKTGGGAGAAGGERQMAMAALELALNTVLCQATFRGGVLRRSNFTY